MRHYHNGTSPRRLIQRRRGEQVRADLNEAGERKLTDDEKLSAFSEFAMCFD